MVADDPRMKIGRIVEGIDLYISSLKSIDDPSQGNFTLEIDSSGLQVILKQGMAVKARSGMWNGLGFSGMPIMKPNTLYNFTYISNQREKYFTYELLNKSVISKMVLDESGKMELFTWNDLARNWIGFSVVPVDKCDAYALCGVNGICSLSNSQTCGCLNRFIPTNWETDWTSGCARIMSLDCQKGDGFIKVFQHQIA
ncbi:hypothetical protein GH714_009364 [Hevea brasiliensis]|uniref:S-locus glycoprotein domain-containing protein n=1 Tax=Hevea brasiliensis TaxID=3981 RepID=A0A6A6KCA1_HEVBR|nr:hypothetical protein GH714_009364 [Hevea brasiliensis]